MHSHDPRILQHSIHRRPTWRWLRARWLVQEGKRIGRYDDEPTRRAVASLLAAAARVM